MVECNQYERPITVVCPQCGVRQYEDLVKFVDVGENDMGQDVLTFVCIICGETVTSLRYG